MICMHGMHQNLKKIPSKLVKFEWNMRNMLNRKKNHISDFSYNYFSSSGLLFTQNMANFRWIFTIIRKIKIGTIWYIIFFFVSAHSASFIKIRPLLIPLLPSEMVCISFLGIRPFLLYYLPSFSNNLTSFSNNNLICRNFKSLPTF